MGHELGTGAGPGPAIRRLALLVGVCVLSAPGCDAVQTATTASVASLDACQEVSTWPGSNNLPPEYSQQTWDDALRVLSEEHSTTNTFTGHVDVAWRYDQAGRVVAYASFATGYGTFQEDNTYDDHGNALDFRLSYPSVPDVAVASAADPWMGTTYQNQYEGQRVVSSTSTPYGPGSNGAGAVQRTFHEDAAGRCDRIETTPLEPGAIKYTEVRAFDAGGRLSRIDVTTADTMGIYWCGSNITLNTLDDTGRVTEMRRWCGTDVTGDPTFRTITSYGSDGGQRVESFDFFNDTPNDVVMTSHGQQPVTHWIRTRSAGCARLDAAIGAPAGLGCRVP